MHRKRQKQRERDRQTDRDRETERERKTKTGRVLRELGEGRENPFRLMENHSKEMQTCFVEMVS